MSKIKVLHSELHERLGGIESFLFNVWNTIDSEQVQFDFLSTFDHPALEDEFKSLGCNIYKTPKHKEILAYSKAVREILDRGYDVVHIHKNSAADVILFHILKDYPNTRVVVHSHNTLPSVGKAVTMLHRLNKNYLYKQSDIHLACSDAAGVWMYGKGDFEVIRNGIDTKRFLFCEADRASVREEFGIPKDAYVVGHVGRFTEQKNHIFLVDIFAELVKRNPKAYLIMIGQGELKGEVQEYVHNKNLSNVIFAGVRKDINKIMMAIDALIFPSKWEGLPVVTIEAQASGMEVFLSNAVSKECVVSDGVHWFDINDSSVAVADTVNFDILDDVKRKLRNKQVVDNQYDVSNTSSRLLSVYQDLTKDLSR